MPAYIALIDWTEQGVRDFKNTVDRYEAAQSAFESLGVRFTNVWWTLGTHDIVATVEAPDDETLGGCAAVGRRARQHPHDHPPCVHPGRDADRHRQGLIC
jgi:uncharacterized protein with GYD domain